MKKSFIIIVLVVIVYIIWSKTGRKEVEVGKYNSIAHYTEFKKDSSTSNIVGIQPFMTNFDYQSEDIFYKKMNFYMKEAQKKGWFHKNTTVVFPEHIASWLVAANEKSSVYTSTKIDDALIYVVLANLPEYLKNYFMSGASDKATAAAFQMKGKEMAEIYHSVYSKLAKNYKVNIVAGSIFLPNPSVKYGQLIVEKGPIYNITALFKSNGEIEPNLIKKKYPINTELPFCVKNEESLPTFNTTSGNLGVVICADAWHGDIYEEMDQNKVSTFIAPSYSTGENIWSTKWEGYNGSENPVEVDLTDINNITLEEAWHKYTLKRIKDMDIQTGITVFLRGEIWDLGTDGNSFIFRNDSIQSVPKTNMPVIFNVEI
ncbi:MAG: hypothetical protein ABFR32_02080 [Bacteroidota bacterium]